MTVYLHELKRGRLQLFIWSAVIAFMIGVCVIIYPEMSKEMENISSVFADMGSFSSAFGLDTLNFGEFLGFFGVECGNVIGLGGAFFAAILGISALAKEEKEGTAEFLLTHPVSRTRVITEKLLAAFTQITIMMLAVTAVALGCTLIIGEEICSEMLWIFLSYYLLMIEICAITFGISAFISGSGLGIGLGIAVLFYFMNIVSNLTEDAELLKYITPYGYTDGGDIVNANGLEWKYVAVGAAFSIISITLAYLKYRKKDIA